MLPINFNRFSFVAQTNLTIFLSFGRQMTHLSRSVGDKMLADMPEGSAADYDGDYGDNYDGEDDMSGSGEGTSCKLKTLNGSRLFANFCFFFLDRWPNRAGRRARITARRSSSHRSR